MAYEDNGAPRYNNGGSRFGGGGYGRQGGSQRRSSSDESTNTTGLMLSNERAGKFLNINYWNRCLSLEIGSYPGGQPLSYDLIRNAQKLTLTMSFAGIHELNDICEEVAQSIKETGSFTPTAVIVGTKKDSIVEVSNGSNIGMQPGVYLVIYKGIDTGKRTNILEVFPFGSTRVIRNYDHNTGAGNEDIRVTGDFKKFCTAVEEAARAFTMAAAHTVSDVKRSEKMATFTALSAIGAALGVDMTKQLQEKRSSGQSSYNRQSNGGQRSSYQSGGYGNAPRFGGNSGPRGGYGAPQGPMTGVVTDDPVDINLDASSLAQVDMGSFK